MIEQVRQSISDAVPIGIVVRDHDGHTVYSNRAALELLDHSGDPKSDPDWRDVLQVADRLEVDQLLDAALASAQPGSTTVEQHLASGARRWLRVNVAPWETNDAQVAGTVTTLEDVTTVKRAEARLRRLATQDPLTGLANRLLANDRLEHAVARHHRTDEGVAVLFCDLDGFKPINDAYGHRFGDGVLVAVANRLSAVTRAPDTVARVGGDEFILIVEGVTDTEELSGLSERIISTVTAPLSVSSVEVQLGISVGVAFAGPGTASVDADHMLTLADATMYLAKADGGDRYRVSTVDAV